MTAPSGAPRLGSEAEAVGRDLAGKLVAFPETGSVPGGLFAPDVFCDFTLRKWRPQARGTDEARAPRLAGHPCPGRVSRSRFDATAAGFVLNAEEEWEDNGQSWCCRELFRADVTAGLISVLAVCRTGDWDTAQVAGHAAAVTLPRP